MPLSFRQLHPSVRMVLFRLQGGLSEMREIIKSVIDFPAPRCLS